MSGADVRVRASASAPDRAGIVLVALILVAAVANLNLSVANVALPSIGEAFDSSQVTLNLIAVGYSLGLAASVLYLGAIGDRYGRKMMLVLGTGLAIPMSLLAAYAPSDEVLFVARVGGGLAAGMAYPTTLALITALWSGPGRTKAIALWSALGGAIAALGPLVSGALLEEFWWGSVFLVTLPLAGVALVMAVPPRPEPRQRDVGSGRQPRWDPFGRPRRFAHPRDQLRTSSERRRPRARARRDRARGHDRFLHPAAARREPAVRPPDRESPHLLGCGLRGDHRFRLAHGRDVRQPAVPPERARLLDARGGDGDPARGARDGRGRTAIREAHRGSRFAVHPALRLRVSVPGLPMDAACLERGRAVLAHRGRVHLHRRGGRACGHTRVALADRVGASDTCRHGIRDGRSPA